MGLPTATTTEVHVAPLFGCQRCGQGNKRSMALLHRTAQVVTELIECAGKVRFDKRIRLKGFFQMLLDPPELAQIWPHPAGMSAQLRSEFAAPRLG